MTRRVAVITPWSGDTARLLDGYRTAWTGATIVTIDNATPYPTAMRLTAMHADGSGVYLRNEVNVGFARANNQGYEAALALDAEVIVFANSDVVGEPWLSWIVASDVVRNDRLYGPSLAHQLVGGRWLPYLEGWCIAGTRGAWERLTLPGQDGPWDADAYAGPYWEDNDLAWRAIQAGMSLVQTAWPVQHLGGQSSGPLAAHAVSFERNRATFARRVLDVVQDRSVPPQDHPFLTWLARPSDMRHHLPWLAARARGMCVELGCSQGISTAALLWGVDRRGGRVISVSTDDVRHLYAGHPRWTFIHGESTDPETVRAVQQVLSEPITLLLLDSRHTYEHVGTELARWAPLVGSGGAIAVHDTGFAPGVRRAVTEVAAARGWDVTFVLPDHGMGLIEVP